MSYKAIASEQLAIEQTKQAKGLPLVAKDRRSALGQTRQWVELAREAARNLDRGESK